MAWPRLIVFTRLPIPGQAKTRLIPALGAEGAAALQRAMAERVLGQAKELCCRKPVVLEVRHQGGAAAEMRDWLGLAPLYRPQLDADLGLAMHEALAAALDEGAPMAVLVGCDLPLLSADILEQAFAALAAHDLALGPATDGGYYLVGLKRPAPDLFAGMAWGRATVLQDTLARAAALGLSHVLLPTLPDLDRPQDLHLWDPKAVPPPPPPDPGLISVIIPALNEEANLPAALESVGQHPDVETLVVDGGSVDRTYHLARELGATALASAPGRARQMNLGAGLSRGGILVFLHADSRLPTGWREEVRRVLARPGVSLGAFRFSLDRPGAAYRALEALVQWRSIALQLPYGDQALFLARERFLALGGYVEQPIMEDYLLVKALARQGRVALARSAVTTSARRWNSLGLLRTTMVNQAMLAGHALGVSPSRLAAWYRKGKG